MSSPSFIISSDDISVGGGYSSSASFLSQAATGTAAVGEALSSASFLACAGYPCALTVEPPQITFSVSSNSIAFGNITSSVVSSGAVTVTTSTNAVHGYATTVATDGEFRSAAGDHLTGVSDGSVTAGYDEYGIGLTGTERAFADDRSISAVARTVASSALPITASATTVTFKAAISPTVPAGDYSQTVTFVSTAEF